MSLKRKISFDELVNENRQQILQDQVWMDRIEQNLDSKHKQVLNRTKGQ